MSLGRRTHVADTGRGPVVAWRARRLREAGLPRDLAEVVAADCAYDLHALLELVDRGCPAELAVRILAPLEGDPC
jgi:hypothetical protein